MVMMVISHLHTPEGRLQVVGECSSPSVPPGQSHPVGNVATIPHSDFTHQKLDFVEVNCVSD
jgi:hypothetical protein